MTILLEETKEQYGWYDPKDKSYIGLLWRNIDWASDVGRYHGIHDDFISYNKNLVWAELKQTVEVAERFRKTFHRINTDHWILFTVTTDIQVTI